MTKTEPLLPLQYTDIIVSSPTCDYHLHDMSQSVVSKTLDYYICI